jgi:hypothetical protein
MTVLEYEMEFDERDCFIVVDGIKIAKRGDMKWISLEPGWSVFDDPYPDAIAILFQNVRVH